MENHVYTGLIGTRSMKTNAISLTTLLDENVELYHNINRSHLNIQFLTINPNNGSNTATMKYQRGGLSKRLLIFV